MVNVELVKFIRRLINPSGAQRFVDSAGFPFDVQPYLELQLRQAYPSADATGLMKYIQTNFNYFMNGDPIEVTRSINNYLLFDPYVIDIFGYPIFIYTDPAHIRQYALYLAGALLIYKWVKK